MIKRSLVSADQGHQWLTGAEARYPVRLKDWREEEETGSRQADQSIFIHKELFAKQGREEDNNDKKTLQKSWHEEMKVEEMKV